MKPTTTLFAGLTGQHETTGTEVTCRNGKWHPESSRINLFFFGRLKPLFLFGTALLLLFLNVSIANAQLAGHCKLNCRDTAFCYNVPDSLIHPPKPTYLSSDAGGSYPCFFDSIWNNAPVVYPVGTTVVIWFVLVNGQIDTCKQNIIRYPPSSYNLCFITFPPVIGGVINICNGQQILFDASCSNGITGLLWNFGNGYYSGNAVHIEPGSHYPPGTYYDTLTVYDQCGVAHDTAFQVVVDSASGPDIYCISVQCPGDTVTYRTHANCTSYTWSVTGGTFLIIPTSTSDSCTVIWGAGPTGTLTLNVSGCSPPLTCPLGTTVSIHIVPATLPVALPMIVPLDTVQL